MSDVIAGVLPCYYITDWGVAKSAKCLIESGCRQQGISSLRHLRSTFSPSAISSPLLLLAIQFPALISTHTDINIHSEPGCKSANEMLTESEISGLTCTKVACVRRERYRSHRASQLIHSADRAHSTHRCADQE